MTQAIEFAGVSALSIDEAIRNAINQAAEQFSNLKWFRVKKIYGEFKEKEIALYRVTVKIGVELANEAQQVNTLTAKQIIKTGSPAKDQQQDFISEGGNSQPL